MRTAIPVLFSVVVALGGCATFEPSGPQVTAPARSFGGQADTCTDIIATSGGILKFCQTARTVDVFESGVDPRQPEDRITLVDDPRVLTALQDELSLRPELAQSRKIVTRSCLIRDRRYVTIAMDSLKRILRTNEARVAARGDGPRLEPIATGAIESVRPSGQPATDAPDSGANAPR